MNTRDRGLHRGARDILLWAAATSLLEWLILAPPSAVSSELMRLSLHGAVGLSLALCVATLSMLGRWLTRLSARSWLRHLPWLSLGLWGHILGAALSKGDWAQSQSWAAQLPLVVGLAFAVGGLSLSLLRALLRPWLLATLCLGASALFSALDLSQLRGLYPALHLSLYLLSGLTALIGLEASRAGSHTKPRVSSSRLLGYGASALNASLGLIYIWLQLAGGTLEHTQLAQVSPRATLLPSWRPPQRGIGSLAEGLKSLELLNREALAVERAARARAEELRAQSAAPMNLLLIIVDTLRYDALYQSELEGPSSQLEAPLATPEDLPFISAWRGKGGVHSFLNAYTQAGRTKLSTPALFRSSEVSLKQRSGGLQLTERLNRAGYHSLALTPEYFLWPVKNGASHLLKPFEQSWHYTEDKQHHALKLWRELLDHKDPERPLFAWLHLYMMHAPYFAGERRLSRRDGPPHERYRRALKTLDQQLKSVIDALDERGMLENTVIALSSDHGEGLGDHHADGHGMGVFDEQSRVPLLIYDPRLKAEPTRLHRELVGNCDLSPTLSALLGLPQHLGDEGRSLLPLMMRRGEELNWPYSYLLSNGNASERGLVTQGREKLSYRARRSLLALYDLKRDPVELVNIAGSSPERVTQLAHDLITQLPSLGLPRSLKRSDPQRWAEERSAALAAASALISSQSSYSAELLKRLTRLADELSAPELLEELSQALKRSPIGPLEVTALRIKPALGEARIKRVLEEHSADPSSLSAELLSLSAYRPDRFGDPWLLELLSALGEPSEHPALWGAWLALSRAWPHKNSDLPHYKALIQQELSSPDLSALSAPLLRRLGEPGLLSLIQKSKEPELLKSLSELLKRRLLSDSTERLELYSAVAALSLAQRLAPSLKPKLRAALRERCLTLIHEDPRAQLKKSAVTTLASLAPTSAERPQVIKALIKSAQERLILVPIIDALSRLPSPETTRFLKKMRRSARTGYARISAKKALKKLKRGSNGKRTKRRGKRRKPKQRSEERRLKKRAKPRRRGRPKPPTTLIAPPPKP